MVLYRNMWNNSTNRTICLTEGPNPITTGGINIPIYDIPTEIFQIAYVAIATLIVIVDRKQRSEIECKGVE